jgi:two-component system, OmpR family, sensor kinase
MSLSIRWRLTLGIAAALLLTVIAIIVTLRVSLQSRLQSDLDRELARDMQQVSQQAAAAGALDNEHLQQAVAPGLFVAVIRDANGNLLAATPRLDPGAFALSQSEIGMARQGTVTRQFSVGGNTFRVLSGPIFINGQLAGIAQVGEDAGHVQEFINTLGLTLLAETAAGAVLAVAIGYLLARSALKPIADVVETASEIGGSHLERRLNAHGKAPELQRLADTFDAMLDRLSEAFQQQRNFVQDVSHELRTPLAALRGNIDVMLMETQHDRQTIETLQRMSAELDRLIRLASNLLYMAHADAGRPIDFRPVELDALCLEVVHQTIHLRPGTKIRLDEVDQVSVSGDRDLLKQMLLNLADNALKYTSEGSEVAVRLRQHDEWASIEVTDSGPGIPPEELPRIFERQYRGSNRNGRSGSGAGIGLAISQWIARVHGGRIDVTSMLGTGSTFTVFLPNIHTGLLPSVSKQELPT